MAICKYAHTYAIVIMSVLPVWPTGQRTTRELSTSWWLYSALDVPENSWLGFPETHQEPMSSLHACSNGMALRLPLPHQGLSIHMYLVTSNQGMQGKMMELRWWSGRSRAYRVGVLVCVIARFECWTSGEDLILDEVFEGVKAPGHCRRHDRWWSGQVQIM